MQFGVICLSARGKESPTAAWDEDLWEMITADELGFREGWVAEHIGGARANAMPAADLFVCKAAAMTKHMRFGPGVRALPYHHPVTVATQAAVCDHLTGGRYMAGFGGARTAPGENYFRQYGVDNDPDDKRAMMHEAIELILRCWEEHEPFDFHGKYWHGERIRVEPKPLQQPRVPVGLANSESISTARLAGEKGFWPLQFYYDLPPQLKELSDAFMEAGLEAGRTPSRADIRVCRFIHVADSVEQARDEVRGAMGSVVDRQKNGAALHHVVRSMPDGGTVEDITFDYLAEAGIFLVGDPETVVRQARELYGDSGGFGVLLMVLGQSVGTRAQRERSMQLFMEQVAPALATLDPREEEAAASAKG